MNKNAIDDDDNVSDGDDDDDVSDVDDSHDDDDDDDNASDDDDRPASRYLNFSCSFHRSDKSRTDREYCHSILLTQ